MIPTLASQAWGFTCLASAVALAVVAGVSLSGQERVQQLLPQQLLECVIECNAAPTWEGHSLQFQHQQRQEQLSQRPPRTRAAPARSSAAARAAMQHVKQTMAKIKEINMMTQGKPFGAAKSRLATLKAILKRQMGAMNKLAAKPKSAPAAPQQLAARPTVQAPPPMPSVQSPQSGYQALMDRMKRYKSGHVRSGRQMIHKAGAPSYSGVVQAQAPPVQAQPKKTFLSQVEAHHRPAPKLPSAGQLPPGLAPQHHIYYEGVIVA